MAVTIQLRRSTAALWTAWNGVLALGEPAIETDTGKMKFGDGVHTWTQLSYSSGSTGPTGNTGWTGPAGTAANTGATGPTGYFGQVDGGLSNAVYTGINAINLGGSV